LWPKAVSILEHVQDEKVTALPPEAATTLELKKQAANDPKRPSSYPQQIIHSSSCKAETLLASLTLEKRQT
jgi:hypothetical protein